MTTTRTWTTAHLAALAPADPGFPFLPRPVDFAGRTVRQAVRLRRGGTALRLTLSNEYGDRPLVVERITVAASDSPARPALLRGAARWTIPPGATATGDPVDLPTAAGDDLHVECFLPGPVPAASYLHSYQRTGRHLPGDRTYRAGNGDRADRDDRTEDEPGAPFPSLYWLARVLVDTAAQGPVVIAYGDSITQGVGTSSDTEQRYPDHLQRRLDAAGVAGAVVLNAGLGGNRLLTPGVGPSMVQRFARDVLAVPEATHVVLMGGINDVATAYTAGEPPPDPAALAGALFALAIRAHARGIRPVLGTITPSGGSRFDSFRAGSNEEVRQAVNRALAAQEEWAVADFGAALADPADPARLAARFDSGDGVHPGDAGARALAAAVPLAALTAPAHPARAVRPVRSRPRR